MKIDKFYKDSLILTASNLVTGIIGFLFSVIISRKLGAEGLGLYGLVMPVYGLLLCITTEGLVTAISKITAVYFGRKDYKNVNKTMTTVFVMAALWSLAVALIAFLTSSGISDFFIRDERASDAVKILCPALVFVPLSAIIKGYFYGLGKFKITASVDIVEKALRVFVLLGSTALLVITDVKGMVSAAFFSLTAGEMISFLLLFSLYRLYRKKYNSGRSGAKRRIQLIFDVLVISAPLSINGFLSSIISTASTLILPRRIEQAGFTYGEALALIGKFTGMAMNIVYLPFIIISSMLTVLVPDLSRSISKKDTWSTESRIMQVLKISCLVGISAVIVSLTIPALLGDLLYNDPELGGMIRFAALAGFTGYVSSPTFGILNGLGKQNVLLRNSLLVSLEGLVLIFIFTGIPILNIYGYGITLIITSITALVINMAEILKYYEVKFELSEIFTTLLIGILSFLLIKLVNGLLMDAPSVIRAAAVIAAGFLSVFFLNAMTEKINNL